MKEIMKIVKPLEDSSLLMKDINQTIEIKTKEQRDRYFGMLLGTLDASLLENMLAGESLIITGDGVTSAGQDF